MITEDKTRKGKEVEANSITLSRDDGYEEFYNMKRDEYENQQSVVKGFEEKDNKEVCEAKRWRS